MTNQAAVRDRYLRDGVQIRLGGLAANLARVASFSSNSDHKQVVASLLEESAFFIEWTARDLSKAQGIPLLELQRKVVSWLRAWNKLWADSAARSVIARECEEWSQTVLRLAGLSPEA